MLSFPFQNWFTKDLIVGGDWRFFWPENLREIFSYSYAWDSSLNTGIGRINVIPWLNTYLAYLGHFYTQVLYIPWYIAEKLLFFLPILLLSFFSAFFLSKLLISDKCFRVLAGFLYCLNTYALMIFAGGQVGVALAYSIAPLILAKFIQLMDSLRSQNQKISHSIVTGLILTIQVMFEPRVAYITLMAVAIYFAIYSLFVMKLEKIIKVSFFLFVIPGAVAILLHFFWILPFLIYRQNFVEQLGSAYSAKGMVQFLSFADFSHTLSLLHPNWPENIFGKTYFLQPEFLILPILAYSSLFFISKIHSKNQKFDNNLTMELFNNRTIIFFALLGLIGAFLAKGVNPPFREVNTWLFQYFPGMNMFRDPTKFYLLIALSYSVLIPFSISFIYDYSKSKIKYQKVNIHIKNQIFNFSFVFLIFTILYLLFLIRPALLGQLGGTFKPREVPKEYVELKNFLSQQPEFFRTFWIPQRQRFGFFSNNQPAIDSLDLLKVASISGVMDWLYKDNAREQLFLWGVKYVIVPYDSLGEIFLKDRKFEERQYEDTIREIKKVTWLKKIDGFGKIAVFELPNPKDHFWSTKENLIKSYKYINPTKYEVDIQNAKNGDTMVFTENFDAYWFARNDNNQINSKPYNKLFNSFVLEKDGNYVLEVYYYPQKYVEIGSAVSLATFVFILGFLKFGKAYKK